MQFEALKVMHTANRLADIMLESEVKKEPLTVEIIQALNSPAILGSKYGKNIVENLVLGAVIAYHSQLRASLLEHGIDIGAFDVDAD